MGKNGCSLPCAEQQGGRNKVGVENLRSHTPGRQRILAGEDENDFLIRDGEKTQGRFADDPQGSEGADVKLGQVIAGDVLYRFPAGLDDIPSGENHLYPQSDVPGASVEEPFVTAGIGGENAANRSGGKG